VESANSLGLKTEGMLYHDIHSEPPREFAAKVELMYIRVRDAIAAEKKNKQDQDREKMGH